MAPEAQIFNLALSILTLLIDVFIVFVILTVLSGNSALRGFLMFLKKYAYSGAFLFALMGVLGSLVYSEVIGFEPCFLCWWQRIFLYPITVLLLIALWRKERVITNYVFGLSIIGSIIALYHSLIQLGTLTSVFCNQLENDCSYVYFTHFGVVTIPFMALTIFATVSSLMLVDKFVKS
jgi:disulfide bond formation protein DsbB